MKKDKTQPLTGLMTNSLIKAYKLQSSGRAFGPIDLPRKSFSGLIDRELVVYKSTTIKKTTRSLWRVSQKGMDMLRDLGIGGDKPAAARFLQDQLPELL